MNFEDVKFILIAVVVMTVAGIFEYRKRNRPCKKCGGKCEVIGVKDPFGKNITKTTTVGIHFGIDHKRLYKLKCKECGNITNEKWK